MTKTQYHKEVNRRFYKLIEESFPHYILDFNEGGGRVYLYPQRIDEDFKFIYTDYLVYYQKEHFVESGALCGSKFEFEELIINEALKTIKEEVQNGK
jgi:hypothetical protein